VIHVVTVADLTRPAMPELIMRYYPVTLRDEEEHLRNPVVGVSGQPWWNTIA